MENNLSTENSKSNKKHIFKGFRIIGMFFVGIAFAVVFALVFGLVVQLIWNWLMPALFGLKVITFWQAVAMIVLAKILFSGFGSRDSNHRFDHRRDRWTAWHSFKNGDWTPNEARGKLEHYRRFWHDEGKASFEDYIGRIEKEEKESKDE